MYHNFDKITTKKENYHDTKKDNFDGYPRHPGIGARYGYSGYAAYCGGSPENTLTADKPAGIETIELNLKHTYYRTMTSEKGKGWHKQIDTVYFRVPEYYFASYGKLQRILAEWYEYKTKEIFVTSDKAFDQALTKAIGQSSSAVDGYSYKWFDWVACDNVLCYAAFPTGAQKIKVKQGWNAQDISGISSVAVCNHGRDNNVIPFYHFLVDSIKNYDPNKDIVSQGGVKSTRLWQYIKDYSASHPGGKRLEVKDGKISADLFADDIDEMRKMDNERGKVKQGYSFYDFDADADTKNIQRWSGQGYWASKQLDWLVKLFGNGVPSGEKPINGVSPIQVLDNNALDGGDEDIRTRLLVGSKDIATLKEEYAKASKKKERVVLFRFAISDYYSAPLAKFSSGFFNLPKIDEDATAYIATMPVFLDFDVIQLSFMDENGNFTVIPCVASPIDIIGDVTPPLSVKRLKMPWWVWAILAAVVLLILGFLVPVIRPLKYVFIGLWYVVTSPIKFTVWCVRKRKGGTG